MMRQPEAGMIVAKHGQWYREITPEQAELARKTWALMLCRRGEAQTLLADGMLNRAFASGAEAIMIGFENFQDFTFFQHLLKSGPACPEDGFV